MVNDALLQTGGIQTATLAAARVGLVGGTGHGALTPDDIDGVGAFVFPQEVGAYVAVGAAHVNGVPLHGPGQQGAEEEEEEGGGGGGVAAFAHHSVVWYGVVVHVCQKNGRERMMWQD